MAAPYFLRLSRPPGGGAPGSRVQDSPGAQRVGGPDLPRRLSGGLPGRTVNDARSRRGMVVSGAGFRAGGAGISM